MCTEHKDQITLLLIMGLFFVSATVTLNAFVIYLIIDFNNVSASLLDVKILSLIISVVIDIFIIIALVAMYKKAMELLKTIGNMVGDGRTVSQYLLSSDDNIT